MPRELPTFRECFRFPLSTPEARRDVLVGGVLMGTLLVGWVFNLGHRLDVVYRVVHREPPYFRGFAPWGHTFRRGLRALCAITLYLTPAAALGVGAAVAHAHEARPAALVLGALAAMGFVAGIYALPGGMTYNAAFDDLSYLYRPDKALRRAIAGGRAYLWAWLVALAAISLSLAGLLLAGVGFFFTSVWAWSVVGYAFSRSLVMSDPEAMARLGVTATPPGR